jgi:7-keto-8-aminopelargonate synthetase-like enzyme
MQSPSRLLDVCDGIGQLARSLGLGLLEAEDSQLDGRTIRLDGRSLLNFCSCSYLGLELDPRLIEGAIDATRRFGTQFSMSRAFVSAPQYSELEGLLSELFGGPTLVLPSTTLATAAALPSLLGEGDAVLLDQRVHMSVRLVSALLEPMGVHLERTPVPHARMDELEARLDVLETKYRRVWFLIDGVFSMHGDLAALDELNWLLERHPSLHLFVDDAHGTSWTGRNGRGHALEGLPRRDRVVVALSLNKSFAAGGGALVFPDEETRQRVRHTSAPTNFMGPLQPPMIGAALASARIHGSNEIGQLQGELRRLVEYVNRRAFELDLPLLHRTTVVPIRFIGLGPQAASVALASHLLERCLLPSCALFPAVAAHQTGIRFTVTRHHELADLDLLLESIADFLPEALARGGVSRADVDGAFELKPTPATAVESRSR